MRLIFTFILIFLQSNVHASELDLRSVSQQRTWLKLLHIDDTYSEIENTDFFLTQHSNDFALSELLATLVEVKANKTDQKGFSFRCRYPARTEFLAQNSLAKGITATECPSLFSWIGGENFAVSVVYADGYLGNPASFYGHLIIKFDSPDTNVQLLNNSLNFGATVPDNENNLVYILKGLTGGYSAKYSSNYFYRYNLNYTEVELRDLWKYTLDLSLAQRRLVAFHAWELMNSQYTYYFTHRNCAYHVAKLLEVVTPNDLVKSNHPFVLPIAVFSAAMDTNVNDKALISSIQYLPSRQTRMRQGAKLLASSLHRNLAIIVSGDIDNGLQGLSQQNQIAVLDVAYDYIEFVASQVDADSVEFTSVNAIKLKIQRARIMLPRQGRKALISRPILQPHEGHKPSLARLSIGQNEAQVYQELLFRPAFYDLYSYGGGILKNSSLSMFEVGLRFSESKNQIAKVHFLNIETYPTGGTGLKFDKDIAWKAKLGFEREYTDDLNNTGEWFVEGGIGKPYQINAELLAYVNINTRLQSPDPLGSRLFVMPTTGFLWTSEHLRIGCHLAYHMSTNNYQSFSRRKIECETSILQTEKFDLRVKYKDFYRHEFQVGISWYW